MAPCGGPARQAWSRRSTARSFANTWRQSPRPQTGIEATPMPVAIERARFFSQRFQLSEDGWTVREHLLTLLAGTSIAGKRVHDANLIATMLAYGITHLLTSMSLISAVSPG
jgi:hypothetical protein